MCGIAGFFDSRAKLDEFQLKSYNEALHRRGPDSSGIFMDKKNEGTIGLCHVRLSILDLSKDGSQPMSFQHLTIVLNGEVYNYKSIRDDLKTIGYEFNSNSDTEVVLKSFHAWGKACVERFTGMFAFAIYNNIDNKIYLCRDRVGVKPLYYFINSDTFIFGSEMKVFFKSQGFKFEVDPISLKSFLNFGYVPHPKTIVSNVFKAEVASWTVFDVSSHLLSTIKYWSYARLYEKEKFSGPFDKAVSITEDLAKEACELRMVSDVPVGVFLSGGFDSTLVTSLLQKDRTDKLKTFTIGFSDGVDESKYAKIIANYLGTEHTAYDCKQQDAIDLIPLLPELFDEPIADISCIPTLLVSKLARQEVKVALSADGGDELFGGYSGFKSTPANIKSIQKIPLPNVAGQLLNLLRPIFRGNHSHINKKIWGISSVLNANKSDQIYQYYVHQSGVPSEILNKLMLENCNLILPSRDKVALKDIYDEIYILGVNDVLRDYLLVKVDRATMGFSLEGREPLLDHKLMEFAASLPYDYKHNGIESKRPLREIVYKYVPKEIMDRPKIGFDFPLDKWLREDLSYLIDNYLDEKEIQKSNVFNATYVAQLVKAFQANKLRYTALIWRLLIFQMWHAKWMSN